jgi:hypothetical protein
MAKRCSGPHPVLQVREFNAHGAVVDCLICEDTFQIREQSLVERYLHCPHPSPAGPGEDKDFFILGALAE